MTNKELFEKFDRSRSEVAKLLAGTISRGLLWGAAALSAYVGIEKSLSPDTSLAVGEFGAAVVLAGAAVVWSYLKDKWLDWRS